MRFANLVISGLVLLVLVLPSASAAGPVIHATWTSSPPTIDGVFTLGEWSGPQIVFEAPTYPASYVLPTYVYFVNDASNLYVMVDAVGDNDDDSGDECLMWFNYNGTGYALNEVKIVGPSGTEMTTPFHAMIGYGSSPNGAVDHKIYEFSIPLSWLGVAPDQPIEFCSPKYQKGGSLGYDSDMTSGITHDNIWPLGLIDLTPPIALDLWGQVQVSASPSPVGGLIEPVNKLAVFAPYLALFGVIGAIAVLFWKRPDN